MMFGGCGRNKCQHRLLGNILGIVGESRGNLMKMLERRTEEIGVKLANNSRELTFFLREYREN